MIWAPGPVTLAQDLKPEDTLMQATPTLSVNGDSILASFANIYGGWTLGEFRARVFGSCDGGREGFEVDTKELGPDGANYVLATRKNSGGFKALSIHGYPDNVTSQLWDIEL